jgi:LysR family transcriptional regulator, glycine cleavage system transcriptional activator
VKRRLPPVQLLYAFEAVAQTLSFTRAAEELCVTQAAISQQIKALETHLGVPLFTRGRKPTLTPAGELFLPAVRDGLQRIADAADQIHALSGTRALRVRVSPFLWARWLSPRLRNFSQHHPGIQVRIHHFYQSLSPATFAREEIDVALVWGDGSWQGLVSKPLFNLDLSPMCSPRMLAGAAELDGPVDLRRCTLLRSAYDWWNDWVRETRTALELEEAPFIYDFDELIQAAIDGHGVALLPIRLVEQHMADGRLVRVSDFSIHTKDAYHVVSSAEGMRRLPVMSFWDWLLAEALADRSRINQRRPRGWRRHPSEAQDRAGTLDDNAGARVTATRLEGS